MISVFQIFKLLIGIIVFIFIMTFFLDITNMYSDLGGSQKEYSIANAFDKTARDVYTSGKSAQFSGFEDLKILMYRPPTLLFGSQKTLSVPLFMIPDKTNMTLERHCNDYEWFRFCWLLSYSDRGVILFSPLENTESVRSEIIKFVDAMPDAYSYGFCNGTESKVNDKAGFSSFVENSMATKTFIDCTFTPEENMRIILFGDVSPSEGMLAISGYQAKESAGGEIKEISFTDADIPALVTGGVDGATYRQKLFSEELKAATHIMLERTKLVRSKMLAYNLQPCPECVTPYPKECGWKKYSEQAPQQSQLYSTFINTLKTLSDSLDSNGNYETLLQYSMVDYKSLRDAGCEI